MSELSIDASALSDPTPGDWFDATLLTAEANQEWIQKLGDPGEHGGFQVEPLRVVSGGERLFASVLYGGRYVFGTASHVRACASAYVQSRRRGKAKS